jgi:hypothetical protein
MTQTLSHESSTQGGMQSVKRILSTTKSNKGFTMNKMEVQDEKRTKNLMNRYSSATMRPKSGQLHFRTNRNSGLLDNASLTVQLPR